MHLFMVGLWMQLPIQIENINSCLEMIDGHCIKRSECVSYWNSQFEGYCLEMRKITENYMQKFINVLVAIQCVKDIALNGFGCKIYL